MSPRIVLACLVVITACENHRSGPPGRVPLGTWGGEGAALIVSEQDAHIHIDCTKGNIPGPIPLDSAGRFDVEGIYNVDAYPVDRGILHPARFTGQMLGRSLALEVRLTDTGRILGPAVVVFGLPPQMGPCPICRQP